MKKTVTYEMDDSAVKGVRVYVKIKQPCRGCGRTRTNNPAITSGFWHFHLKCSDGELA